MTMAPRMDASEVPVRMAMQNIQASGRFPDVEPHKNQTMIINESKD